MSNGKEIEVRELKDADFTAWNTFVSKSPQGSIYSTSEYLEILCRATGGNFKILGAFRSGELEGGIALYEERQAGLRIVSNRLLLYYHGIVLREYPTRYPSEKTARELAALGALQDELSRFSCSRLVLHNRSTLSDLRPFLSGSWIVRPSYSYVVHLTDLKAQWELVEKNLRRLIRRSGEEGVTARADDDFDSFYRLHRETHERKGAPLYLEEKKFRDFYSELRQKNLGHFYNARLADGKVVSAQLVLLGAHPMTHTVSAATDEAYLNLGVTPFLRWKAFEELARLGYKGNDLTDAALNSVTHFKSQLGGELVTTSVITKPDRWDYRIHAGRGRVVKKCRAAARRLLGGLGA